MQEKNPKVSIVVLNWNGLVDTKTCLRYVHRLTYKNVEIIVVDNGSKNDSKEYLKNQKNIILVDNATNRGFTGGHIDGLKASTGDYILLLNNDAIIEPSYIENALPYFNDPSVAAVSGRAYQWEKKSDILNTKVPYYAYININPYSGETFFESHDNSQTRVANSVSGSAVIIKKEHIDKYGYLYEPFFAYFEETDLFARFKRSGLKIVYSPALRIWHKGGASSNSYFQYNQLLKNRYIFAVRNFEARYLVRFLFIYTKLGLPCLWLQYKKNDQQTMHRAYANAFLKSIVNSPRWFFGRLKLSYSLGRSKLNTVYRAEQKPVSLVCSIMSTNKKNILKELEALKKFKLSNVNNEVVAVFNEKHLSLIKDIKTNKLYNDLHIVINKGYFETNGLNLGWLSAKNEWIYLIEDSLKLKYDGPYISAAVVTAEDKEFNCLFDSTSGAIIKREVLELSGGLVGAKSTHESLKRLFYYCLVGFKVGMLTSPHKLIRATSQQKQSKLYSEVTHAIKFDKASLHSPSKLALFMSRRRRLQQVFAFIRWLNSFKIPIRLKFARLKNMVVFAISFNVEKLRTEMKHIRNEVLKAYNVGRFIREQNIYTKKITKSLKNSWHEIPIFVICRDRVDSLVDLVDWLEKAGHTQIIFIDNDSIYPPLVEYFASTKYQVIRTGRNVGHKSPWQSGFIKTLVPNSYYIVTDPDVIPIKNAPLDAVNKFLKIHEEFFEHQKVGFGLKIDDLPGHFHLKDAVISWENQFWDTELSKDVYEAPLDTTFALYKPFNYIYFLSPSIRTGGSLMARHVPWYVDNLKITNEERFYRDRANNLVTSWSVDELDERYVKEIAKIVN